MQEVVVKVQDDHADLIAPYPALAANVANVKKIHLEIKALDVVRDGLTDGTTTGKTNARTALIETTSDICGLLLEFANDTNNAELAGAVDYKISDIRRFSDTQLETFPNVILGKLQLHLPGLSNYSLTQASVDDLETKINTYKEKKPAPRTLISQRSTHTKNMASLFTRMKQLLKSTDRLMKPLKQTQPDFYNLYKAARVIVDRGGKHSESGEEKAALTTRKPGTVDKTATPPAGLSGLELFMSGAAASEQVREDKTPSSPPPNPDAVLLNGSPELSA